MMRTRRSANFSIGLLVLFIIIMAAAAAVALSSPSPPASRRHLAAARVLLPEADQQEIRADDVVFKRIGYKRRSRSPGYGSAGVPRAVSFPASDNSDSVSKAASPPPGTVV
ncbi:hypothetical protein LINGRAHAP2_LOCUS5808 [Linum grandiflorum]